MKIAIGEITDKGIRPQTENFSSFENFIKDFCTHIGQTIKSSKRLAEMMAGKDRKLEFEDILHYQKIIATRTETQLLKQEMDVVGVEAINNETGDFRN